MTTLYRFRQCTVVAVAAAVSLFAALAWAQLVGPHVKKAPLVTFPDGVAQRHVVVRVNVEIDPAGTVSEATEKSRDPADAEDVLVARAIEAVKAMAFDPATRDGVAIKSSIVYTITFDPPPDAATSASSVIAPTSASSVIAPTSASSAKASAVPLASASAKPPPDPLGKDQAHEEGAEVTVVGHAAPRPHGLSDLHLHVGALAIVPRLNASELLKLAPGILLTNEGGEGHAEQVFMRGFDAREGQDVEFSVDGVPINDSGNLHGNGYADTHFIIPELITSLRVVEGPFAPQQGNYAVAGSADYELGLENRGLTAKYTIGSFGSNRLLFLWGPKNESIHTFGGAEIYKTDGFGMNRDARRGTAIGQYETSLTNHSRLRLTATGYATSYHSAGVLRDDDYARGRVRFFDSYDPLQGGDASRFSLALDYEATAEETAFHQLVYVVDRGMRLRENFTGSLLDTQQVIQSPHGQRGDLLDLDFSALTFGARGSARWKGNAFGLPQELEVGYFARGDATHSTQYRMEAATGHPYKLENDLTSKLGDIGAFADVNLRFTKWLGLRGGLRADVFTFDVLDGCAVHDVSHPSPARPPGDASCFDQQNFGAHREPVQRASTASAAFMPRASVVIGPIDHVTLAASYGQGIRSTDPSYITQDTQTPFASIRAWEGGVGYTKSTDDFSLTARSVFFQTKVDRDLVFSESAGRNTLGGGSTRTGWLGAVRATGSFFDESINATLVRSEYDDTHLLVPYVPDLVVRSDTALFAKLPFRIGGSSVRGALGTGVSYVGHRALPYGQRSDALFVVDASATLGWRSYEIGLVATNLLGRRYRLGEFNYASDFHTESQATLVPARHFTAGAPRAFFLSFSATFGGPSHEPSPTEGAP